MRGETSAKDLDIGITARIVSLDNNPITSKLLALGIITGKTIEKVREAPFGGSAYFRLDNHLLALRNEESSTIRVTKENG
jgi:Fe2+ transport system protein FeoA